MRGRCASSSRLYQCGGNAIAQGDGPAKARHRLSRPAGESFASQPLDATGRPIWCAVIVGEGGRAESLVKSCPHARRRRRPAGAGRRAGPSSDAVVLPAPS